MPPGEQEMELEEGAALELPARPPVVIKTDAKYEDEYDSQEELGKGKFGVVYSCERLSDQVELAAKFIKKTAISKQEVKNTELAGVYWSGGQPVNDRIAFLKKYDLTAFNVI